MASKAPGPAARIGRLLLAWYARGHRDLPWRDTRDPYRIWVSEIMLQQTRAQAVIPYYHRFLERFPSVEALAAAAEDEVLALWSGLGYYSRARNLRLAARQIVDSGGFPRSYEGIRGLPGIGDYTAAAVASIAFDLPYAVLDGNVLRVVARVANDAADISAARTRERFRAMAQGWLDAAIEPGHFNQALMELGATVCLPRKPLCLVCPLAGGLRGAPRRHGGATSGQAAEDGAGPPGRHPADRAPPRADSAAAPLRGRAAWRDSGTCRRRKTFPRPALATRSWRDSPHHHPPSLHPGSPCRHGVEGRRRGLPMVRSGAAWRRFP